MSETTVTLQISPAASGKSEAALQALTAVRHARGLLLVSGGQQQRNARARLKGQRRVGVHQFDSLARLILRMQRARVPTGPSDTPGTPLSETGRLFLLRAVLRDLAAAGTLPIFADAARKPGFVATVGALISEAQQAEITPQALAAASATRYDAELGAIYAAYLDRLQELDLTDTPRRLELARAAVREQPDLLRGIALLVVDGFDQFTPLQLGLLAELARALPRTLITLTGSADSRPAHRRFSRTAAQLVAALQPAVQFHAGMAPHAGDVLAHIRAHLFDFSPPPPIPSGGVVRMIAAADREREIRAVLRQVRALLQDGSAPEQVALLLRGETAYVPLLREVAAEYGLPLAIDYGLVLSEAPAVAALLMALRLPLESYPARAISEVWRSLGDGRLALPADWRGTAEDAEQPLSFERAASLLDRVCQEFGIAGGLPRLRKALQKLAAAEPAPEAHEEEEEEEEQQALLSPADAASLLALLEAFAALLAPPTQAALAEYVLWLKELPLHLRQQKPAAADPPAEAQADNTLPADDLPAQMVRRWSSLLEELAAAAYLLDEPTVSYADFITELGAALRAARYGTEPPTAGKVAVLSVLAVRGLHFDHVLVLGMADGEFPRKLPAPPLYTRRERAALARRGVPLIPPDPADERSLFYETVARARRSLTLSHTYLDEAGNPLPASPYLQAITSLLQPESVPTLRIRAGSAPTLDEAASHQEELIAWMHTGSDEPQPEHEHPASLAAHVRRACAEELAREETGPYGPFEGLLHDADLLAALQQRFGPSHLWSVTRFNDYITCPFRFFAAHVLNLQQRSDPEEGMERVGRGRINHAILAKAGIRWRAAQHHFAPEQEQEMLHILRSAADEVLADFSARADFVQGSFWEWEQADLRYRLERAVRRMIADQSDWSEFRLHSIEKGFNPRAPAPPLALQTAAGNVLVVGRIDRIDQRADGALALIDYKSSSRPRSLEDTLNGYDLQLAIYLLAAERLIVPGEHVERAAFWHLGSGRRSTALTDRNREQALSAMHERVAQVVQGARAGDFAVRPRDRCPLYCAFVSICRRNLAKRDAHGSPI